MKSNKIRFQAEGISRRRGMTHVYSMGHNLSTDGDVDGRSVVYHHYGTDETLFLDCMSNVLTLLNAKDHDTHTRTWFYVLSRIDGIPLKEFIELIRKEGFECKMDAEDIKTFVHLSRRCIFGFFDGIDTNCDEEIVLFIHKMDEKFIPTYTNLLNLVEGFVGGAK